jgi:hypothetical protein
VPEEGANYMRRYLFLIIPVVSASLVALSAVPASAVTHDVLTIGKVGGTNVSLGAILKANLVSTTKATFATSSGNLTCSASSFTAKVTANPPKPGTAKESLTAQSFSKCVSSVSGVTVSSIKVGDLPYNVTVSDASGFPVKVSQRSSTSPLKTTVVLNVSGVGTITCIFVASSISGHASNTGNTVGFSNQKFVKGSGSNGFCPASGTFTAKYGPVLDTSVTGSPRVFVN